jgi:integrase
MPNNSVGQSLRLLPLRGHSAYSGIRHSRHTYRSWLDSVGTSVGVPQTLMRHADIRTTMNLYGEAFTEDMRDAHEKVVRLVLPKTI